MGVGEAVEHRELITEPILLVTADSVVISIPSWAAPFGYIHHSGHCRLGPTD